MEMFVETLLGLIFDVKFILPVNGTALNRENMSHVNESF